MIAILDQSQRRDMHVTCQVPRRYDRIRDQLQAGSMLQQAAAPAPAAAPVAEGAPAAPAEQGAPAEPAGDHVKEINVDEKGTVTEAKPEEKK